MRLILFLSIFLLPAICSGQIKPIGEEPLILEKLDFNTKINALYPDKNKSDEFKDHYKIFADSIPGFHLVVKETIYENEFDESKKPIGIEYRQQSSSSQNVLAVFGKQSFNKINVATTVDNKIKVIGAVATKISESESGNFIEYLTKKYGAFKKLKGEFGKTFHIYEWKTKDRTFRYAPIFNDEQNTLRVKIDENKKSVIPIKKEPHFEGYFYVIKNGFMQSMNSIKSGDFAYLNKN